MSNYGFSSREARDSLGSGLHPLITQDRETGNAHYITCRHYPEAGHVEISAIKLEAGEDLRRGGGARRKHKDKSEMDELTLNKSISRSRTNIRRKTIAMNADRLLTLTFRENVTDPDEAWECFKVFCKLMRFRYRDRFQYVAVPEEQKRGAIHFHLALSGYYGVNAVRRFWLKACGDRQGNIDITSPHKFGKKSWNPRRIARYISKYISKSETVDFNKRRYSTGGKIQLPDPQKGWLALGMPVVQILRQVIEKFTRNQIECVWESAEGYGLIYCST